MSLDLTDDQIREFLTDLGLPQVDPTAFRAGTLPELLRGMIDLGRIRPQLRTTQHVRNNFDSLGVAVFVIDLVAPAPNEIAVVRNMALTFTNAATESVVWQKRTPGPVLTTLWEDVGGPFAAARYLGGPGQVSDSWGALYGNGIAVAGVNPDATNAQQQLQFAVISAAAVSKTGAVDFDVDFYQWEDWPGL